MSVSGVSSGANASAGAANYLSSPAVRFAQLQDSSLSTLFGGASGSPNDLAGFTATAVAMPLFQQPGLLTGLTQWDGSLTPGSERVAAAAPPTNSPTTPLFSFNPFDQASWWTNPKGSSVDTTA